MARDFARALDPAMLARDAEIDLDDWQERFVRSSAPQLIGLIPRQHGKTEAAVVKALSVATTEPESTILIASPAQRLSDEFIVRARKTYSRIQDAPALTNDAARRIAFANGSRVIALPGDGDGDTIRGLSNIRMAIVDECSRCSDALITAIRPMLATNPNAQLLYLSTPAGKRGAFYETWTSDDSDWERFHVNLGSCARITPEFLARERKNLGETAYRVEYGCEFLDSDTAAFSSAIVDAAFSTEIRALWR